MKRERIQDILSIWIIVMVMIFVINIAQAYEEVSGVIPDGTVWTTGTTYYVVGSVTINSGTTLTIRPGVFVKFAPGKSMTISGTLDAQATEESPTYFTSKDDDTVGEVIDGSDGTPSPNDWGYLYPNGAGSSNSVLNYAIIRYGQYGVYNSGSSLTIRNSDISYNYYEGIYASNASPTISGGVIAYNGREGIELSGSSVSAISSVKIHNNGGHGIYGPNSVQKVLNCTIENNGGHGIYVTGQDRLTISGNIISGHTGGSQTAGIVSSAADIKDNTITGNTYPLMATAGKSRFSYSGNTIENNTYNTAMGFSGGALKGVLYNSSNLPTPINAYVVIGGLTVSPDTTLVIQPGAVVKFLPGQSLTIKGTLIANASEGDEIAFTSFKDDEYGGDTNADGDTTSPSPNDWGYLYPYGVGSNNSVLNYAIIRYGQYGVYNNGSDLTIRNSDISHNYYDGIYVSSASPRISGSDIISNGRYGIYFNSSSSVLINNSIINNANYGVYLTGSSQPTIGSDPAELANWNDIYANGTYNLYNNTSNDIIATPVYWGSLEQAEIETRIYDLEDNPSKGKVSFIPWTNAEHDTLYDGGSKASPTRLSVVKMNNAKEILPDKFSLLQNYPNPFNPDTWIPYWLPQSADVTIQIYNVSGNVVRTINLGRQVAGFYLSKDKAAYWDGKDDYGERVSSGVYFYQIKAGKFISVKKAVITK